MTFMKLGAIIAAVVFAIGLFIWGVHEINRPENKSVDSATVAVSETIAPLVKV